MTDSASRGQPARKRPKRGPIRRTRRWLSTDKPLSHALLVVVVFGLIVAFIAWLLVSWILGQGLPWTSSTSDTSRLDVTKLALTVVGGAGAFVALTVAYRRQKDLEDGRFTERFGAAAAQLGAATPAERIAGVYAMAGVADRYSTFAQWCIDVLCGYLRLPFDPDLAKTHLTQIIRHTPAISGSDGESPATEDYTYELVPNDREVRDTIIRVIAAHVERDREIGWHDCDFVLTGATLTTAPFGDSDFRGLLDCTIATFTSRIGFDEARFGRAAGFNGATFAGDARFDKATFDGDARFDKPTFDGDARFDSATFDGDAGFDEARFSGTARFDKARFSGTARFNEATFGGDAGFDSATFSGRVGFNEARFRGAAWFNEARFSGAARFNEARFSGDAGFDGATFGGTAGFNGAKFYSPSRFGGATFGGAAGFKKAEFITVARFVEAAFISHADFGGVTFGGVSKFDRATFCGRLIRLDGTVTHHADAPHEPLLLGPALGIPDPVP